VNAKIVVLLTFIAILVFTAMMLIPSDRGSASVDVSGSDHRFTFSFTLGINDLTDETKNLDIWIPFPSVDQHQQVESFEVASGFEYEMITDPVYGNQIMHFTLKEASTDQIDLKVEFQVVRTENNSISAGTISTESGPNLADYSAYLSANRLVPLGGIVKEEADSVVIGANSAFEKMKMLYYHLTKTMRYDKSGDGWGNGDALFACDTRTGNCTDIHSLFISMARSLDVPARFIIGFPLPEDEAEKSIAGYHCWSEFYIEGRGWIPVDISEAIKHPEKEDYFFGHLDNNRISFTIGRDIELDAISGTQVLNYFIYPHVLVDGQKYDGVDLSFEYTRN